MSKNITLSLLGNPNCGKTAIFNLLSGLNQKVSNYPGITVEKKVAQFKLDNNTLLQLEDFPGAYSTIPQSLDEKIVSSSVLDWMKNSDSRPDGIVYVADLTNIRRNLFFLTQLLPLDIPIILLLNMSDLVSQEIVDTKLLKKSLGVHDVILFSAANKTGLSKFKNSITDIPNAQKKSHNCMPLSSQYKKLISPLTDKVTDLYKASNTISEQLSFSLLCNRKQLEQLHLERDDLHEIVSIKTKILDNIDKDMKPHLKTMESDLRYAFIDDLLSSSKYSDMKDVKEVTVSEKIDRVLTHSFFGPFIYVGILYFIFSINL